MLAVKEYPNNKMGDVNHQGNAVDSQVEQCQRLARVLTMTKDMLHCAKDAEWEEVTRLDNNRKADLEACFSQPVLIDKSPVVAEAVAALLHLNEELMSLVKQARDQVSGEGQQLNKNKSAVNSYLDNK